MRKTLFLIFLVTLFQTAIHSEDLPLLAVPSINGNNISDAAASTCRNMVETALLKTGQYSVLSYTDMEEILSAQAFTLTGCTDESCAVEIGELLAAENIVVGELTGLGDQMVLSIRLVNVSTGKTMKAEIQNIESLADLQQGAFEASYRLAGLTYIAGVDKGVSQYGSLYVLAPDNTELDVFLDGKSYGTTPVLIEEIGYGSHILEVKREGYLFEQEVVISSKDIQEIVADVQRQEGNLFLTILPPSAAGYRLTVNSVTRSPGLIQGLQAGECLVSVTGNGWEYEGRLPIVQGEINKHSIALKAVGTCKVNAPNGSAIILVNKDDTVQGIRGQVLSLRTGDWNLSITHPDYEDYADQITVIQGELTELHPLLNHTELYTLHEEQELLEAEKAGILAKRNKIKSWQIATGIATVVGGGLTGLFEYLIPEKISALEDAHTTYMASAVPTDAASLWGSVDSAQSDLDLYRLMRTSSLGLAAVSGVTSGILLATKPSTRDVDERIASVQERIDGLE